MAQAFGINEQHRIALLFRQFPDRGPERLALLFVGILRGAAVACSLA